MRILVAIALLAAAPGARAAQAVQVSVEDLAATSDVVVHGRVVALSASWVDGGRHIETIAEVEPGAVWRGKAGARVKVLVPGGEVGDIAQRVSGAPAFARGEEVVVFLRRAEAGAFRVSGLAQGKFTVRDGTARPDLRGTSFVATRIGHGHRAAEAMAIAELERRVRGAR